ncbi:hypothetical protein [Maritalea mediterranea]|uniref:Uncharacterized protein n=1 Tax=Maritalea mediterranea TaxID=2909667 RepID=A0ABS9E4U7_9HYPH|nr:hypothetical protein [Maritalea mediterranea]MCF4097284.1 hypothetical protein [Maritalea mediterranea]
MRLAFFLWLLELLTLVPYILWYLLFAAERSQYPLLITFIIVWITGYHAVVLPLIAMWRVRKFFKFLQEASSLETVRDRMSSPEKREAFITAFARENRIPKLIAKRIYARVEQALVK